MSPRAFLPAPFSSTPPLLRGQPGRLHHPHDPDACRLIRIASPHPDEWPWRRLTGIAADVPPQHSDLSAWQPQPWSELTRVLGCA